MSFFNVKAEPNESPAEKFFLFHSRKVVFLQGLLNKTNMRALLINGSPNTKGCTLLANGEGNYIPWDTLAEFFGKNL